MSGVHHNRTRSKYSKLLDVWLSVPAYQVRIEETYGSFSDKELLLSIHSSSIQALEEV